MLTVKLPRGVIKLLMKWNIVEIKENKKITWMILRSHKWIQAQLNEVWKITNKSLQHSHNFSIWPIKTIYAQNYFHTCDLDLNNGFTRFSMQPHKYSRSSLLVILIFQPKEIVFSRKWKPINHLELFLQMIRLQMLLEFILRGLTVSFLINLSNLLKWPICSADFLFH